MIGSQVYNFPENVLHIETNYLCVKDSTFLFLHAQIHINIRKPEIMYEKTKIRHIVFSLIEEGSTAAANCFYDT